MSEELCNNTEGLKFSVYLTVQRCYIALKFFATVYDIALE